MRNIRGPGSGVRAARNPAAALEQMLRRSPVFAPMDDAQRAAVAKTARQIKLEDGENLCEYGRPAERFFLVQSGRLKLYRLSPSGNEKVIDIIHPGRTFAETTLFMDEPGYPMSADAIGPGVVVSFSNKVLMEVLRESPTSCLRLMARFSMNLRQLLTEIDHLTLQNATCRLASFLVSELHQEQREGSDIRLSVPKNVIASRLSIKPETLSRILHQLSEDGVLRVEGKIIHVTDEDRLSEYDQLCLT